jgi:hypothetical protein
MTSKDLSTVLDRCLAKLQAGKSLDEVLADYPEMETELRPVLESVLAIWEARGSDTVPIAAMVRSRNALLRKLNDRMTVPLPRRRFGLGIFSLRYAAISALIVVVLLGLVFTGMVSAQSLPGQPLYPVKIAAEKFTLSLPASPSTRLEQETSFDRRRLDEVETLRTQQRAQDVDFSGFLTRDTDEQWQIGDINLSAPQGMLPEMKSLDGTLVYLHGKLAADGSVMVEWVNSRVYSFHGRVNDIANQQWQVEDVYFDVGPNTKITGSPAIGKQVQVSAIRTIQNHLVAVSIQTEGVIAGEPQENSQPSIDPTQEMESDQPSASLTPGSSDNSEDENNNASQPTQEPGEGDPNAAPSVTPKSTQHEDDGEHHDRTAEPTNSQYSTRTPRPTGDDHEYQPTRTPTGTQDAQKTPTSGGD